MALATDSILRYCGGVWLFAARWGCLVKNLYPSNIVKAYYLASDYNSFRAMQDGLATPKKQSKWMLESNQRMLNLEFNRPVRIYYDRFVALQGLLKVTDKKDPNRSIEFGEYCYKQFILKYDIDQDKKKLQEELGYEPVQASVVSSIIGKRYVNSFAQDLKMALNVNLIEHVQNLSLKMFPKIKSFLPLLNQYKSNPKGSLLDLEDESLLFYTGVTYRSKL